MFESLDRYFGSDDQVCVPDGGFRSLLHAQTEALTQMKRVRPRLSRQKVARVHELVDSLGRLLDLDSERSPYKLVDGGDFLLAKIG